MKKNKIYIEDLPDIPNSESLHQDNLIQRMQVFGYTSETMRFMLIPLIHEKRDPIGSMGNDSSLACLSDKPRMLYDYFKQMFAQVSNPPLDAIREKLVTQISLPVGRRINLLEENENQSSILFLEKPIIDNHTISSIKNLNNVGMKSKVISTLIKLDNNTLS